MVVEHRGQGGLDLKPVSLDGVTIHYWDQGHGSPIVFVHGGLSDYREWHHQLAPFSQQFRTIAYSRRYNYPNQNRGHLADYSARIDARDLAALLQLLGLKQVHVVGRSYGAYAALFLALERPELVRSLVLAEPPIHCWVSDSPDGGRVFSDFMSRLWTPLSEAFAAGNQAAALGLISRFFFKRRAVEDLPDSVRTNLLQNISEWQALATSTDAYPDLPRDRLSEIEIPCLMFTGDRTLKIHRFVNDELQRVLRHAERFRIPEATHEIWSRYPKLCREKCLSFLAHC